MPTILDIAVEIQCKILYHCTKNSMLCLLRTCRQLGTVVRDHSIWWRTLVKEESKIMIADDVVVDYAVYCAFNAIWRQNGKLKQHSFPTTGLSGIPGFTTIDATSSGGDDYGGVYYRHEPGGRDHFIQGILTDGFTLLLGFTNNGQNLGIINYRRDTPKTRVFTQAQLYARRWPKGIQNAMFHSGLLILINAHRRPILFDLSDEDLIRREHPGFLEYECYSISISRNIYCLGVLYKVLVFDRKSHKQVAELVGITKPIDIAVRGTRIWALAGAEMVCQWDLQAFTDNIQLLEPNKKSPRNYDFHATVEDTFGWERHRSILPGKDDFALEDPYGYAFFNSEFAEIKTKTQGSEFKRLQINMTGDFIARADLKSRGINIYHTSSTTASRLSVPDKRGIYGDFIGFTLDNRSIICFYVNGISISSIICDSLKVPAAADELFNQISSSRMIRLRQIKGTARQIVFERA